MNPLALAGPHQLATVQCTGVPGQVNNCVLVPHNAWTFFGVFGVFVLLAFVFTLVCDIKIITKAGYSGWYILTAIVPILNFVFFMIFVFGKWPIQTRLENAERGGSRSYGPPPQFGPTGTGPTPSPGGPPPGSFAPPTAFPVQSASSVHTAAPVQTAERKTIYCSWCGKPRAVDAAAIHHCGSKDRPAVYCMNCGTPFEAGAANCASCGTPATQISR
jgi:uncharacterized membrane protein YhaH (DUF805 family)